MSSQYEQSSALGRHFLDSILPYQKKPFQPRQITKSKQFYRPQKFIWNNPHRTSQAIKKFYHQYNQKYQQQIAPKIKQLQDDQRRDKQLSRIRRLSQIKQQSRNRFFTRQKQRINIEALSGTRQPINSESDLFTSAAKKYSTVTHYHPKPSTQQPMIPDYYPSKIPKRHSQKIFNIQKSYLDGVQKSDNQRLLINKLLVTETHRRQNQLRDQFQKQKQINSKKMSQISRFNASKMSKFQGSIISKYDYSKISKYDQSKISKNDLSKISKNDLSKFQRNNELLLSRKNQSLISRKDDSKLYKQQFSNHL